MSPEPETLHPDAKTRAMADPRQRRLRVSRAEEAARAEGAVVGRGPEKEGEVVLLHRR